MIFSCISIFIICSTAAFFIYRTSCKQKQTERIFAFAAAAILVFSLGLEVSVFNFNYYNTRGNSEISLNSHLSNYENDDGTYTVPYGAQIEFTDLNTEIDNLHIALADDNDSIITVKILLTDEANSNYYSAPERNIYKDVGKSEYINIHTSGRSEKIALSFSYNNGCTIIKSVSANCQRPFEFSLARVLVLSALLFLIFLFKPNSALYKKKLSNSADIKNSLITGFLCLETIIIIFFGTANPVFMGIASENYNTYKWSGNGIDFVELGMENHNQYDELAQAILQGKTYIDNDDVPQSLIDMDNPYDTVARAQLSELSGDSYRWDVAYYNGHYYVYFGIVPLLIMYLPFRALTGSPFPSAVGIMVFALIFSIGVFKLLDLICRKRFKNISLGAYLAVSLTFINCCGMLFLVKRPDFYSVPIITAMTFVTWGIYFWLKGLDGYKNKYALFTAGSLCCALSVGCRPQAVLVCAIAVPLFFEYLFKDKRIIKKDGIKELLSLAVPFVFVAAGIMYYNFIRFGSPFDFGSSYNLTTNDVTKRGFDFARTGLGIFTYLFQPPSFTSQFPFIQAADIETGYIGKTIYANCFGGLITSLPILWFIFALPKVGKTLREKNLLSVTATLIAIGIALVVADTQAGGLLQRYYSDFGYIFFLAASLVIFALCEIYNDKSECKTLNTLINICAFLSIFYTIALAFSVSDVTIDTKNPTLFGKVMHLVQFWM